MKPDFELVHMSADQEAKGGRRFESDTRRCMVGTGYRCGMRLGGRELMIDGETEAFRIKTWRAVYFRIVSPSRLTSSIISTLKKCIPNPYMVRVSQDNGILLSTTLIGIIRRPHDLYFFISEHGKCFLFSVALSPFGVSIHLTC